MRSMKVWFHAEHAEHGIVNGLDLTAYRANVSEVYTGAEKAFVQAKAAKDNKCCSTWFSTPIS